MPSILHDFLLIYVPLFVVVNPAGSVPIFIALTSRFPDAQRRRIALRASTVAATTAVLFVILGQAILSFVGVHFADFQIAGGILLVVLAIIDLLIPGKPAGDPSAVDPSESIGVVPLAVPLIVGPATLTTSLLLVNTYSENYNQEYGAPFGQIIVTLMVCIALLINLFFVFIAMWNSDRIIALVGRNTMTVINKIVMILLAAIAVSLIRQGIVSIVQDLHKPAAPATQAAPVRDAPLSPAPSS